MTYPVKVDSNITGLAYAEEASLKTLPGSPVWYGAEPNSYSDFGGTIATVAREFIQPSRQIKKGTTTDLDASAGFSLDFTKSNWHRLMQGFFFADAHEKPDTQPLTGSSITITGAVTSTSKYTAASGLGVFLAGSLILASGFTTAANNGLKRVTASSGTDITQNTTLVDETPTSTARIQTVGFQFAADDAVIVYSGGTCTLTTTIADLTTLSLTPGEWVFLGGDTSTLRFANNQGYARVKSIAAHAVVFDETRFTPVSETTTGSKTVQIFFGKAFKNEYTTSLIKRRTFQWELQLGNDGDGIQAEYVTGSVPNEFSLDVKTASKLEASMSFVGCAVEYNNGLTGIKAGTRIAAPGDAAYNTTSDVHSIKIHVNDPSNPNPSALFGYASDVKFSINNNVKPLKAIGVLGAFDTVAGNFNVTGTATAYFSTVEAIRAIRNNADVGMSIISAKSNYGFVVDIPLLTLGGGKLAIQKDTPVTVALDTKAAQNSLNYTALIMHFEYLPNLAMPA